MKPPTLLSRYGEAFLRLLYPSACALCRELLRLEEKGICSVCLARLSKQKFSPPAERIRVSLKYADEAWALFHYEAETREVLHKIKFERRRDLVQLFRPFLNEFFERRPELTHYQTLIPIPLDPKRRWQREFNQSGLLAESVRQAAGRQTSSLAAALQSRCIGTGAAGRQTSSLAAALQSRRIGTGAAGRQTSSLAAALQSRRIGAGAAGLRDTNRLTLQKRVLLKKRSTPPQSRLGREARQQNLQETFRLSRFPRLHASSVLLIDDIFTTGATFEEAARVLKASGVSQVGYLALSRALLN